MRRRRKSSLDKLSTAAITVLIPTSTARNLTTVSQGWTVAPASSTAAANGSPSTRRTANPPSGSRRIALTLGDNRRQASAASIHVTASMTAWTAIDRGHASAAVLADTAASRMNASRKRERCSPMVIGNCTALFPGGGQMRLKTSEPLVPPKPKLFFSATSIFIGRATLAQ